MPRMARGTQIGDHDPDRSIGANVIHIPVWVEWVGCVTLVG